MQTVINFLNKRKAAKNSGEKAEQTAEDFLLSQGLCFVERNFFCRLGEIDLIFFDQDTYIFIEVRFRANKNHGSAAESIGQSKLKKIRNSAALWLQKNNKSNSATRFDAILFDEKIDKQHLTWLKAVF
ncbi:YraN family protein [Marinomonas sp. CT5]|uniref:YraN family protein n=1 Tax=Marinomonas sp. CT5 TaxID=2066133 RepID=UPI0018123545|nr:YraN family protein [Marinomonas sp. CT5]NVK75351.1 YraN family protein [Oceanospirillaceae bacterium]QUX96068.1 YraN family protein [Marinomonas sp. CT5]